MTHKTRNWLVVALISLISIGSFGQHSTSQQEKRPKFPAWVSDKGYWVVEGNINSPFDHIVRFYNNENELLYKETLTGIKLNPEKRKVKMKLKKILESAVLVRQKKKSGLIPDEKLALVRSVFY